MWRFRFLEGNSDGIWSFNEVLKREIGLPLFLSFANLSQLRWMVMYNGKENWPLLDLVIGWANWFKLLEGGANFENLYICRCVMIIKRFVVTVENCGQLLRASVQKSPKPDPEVRRWSKSPDIRARI